MSNLLGGFGGDSEIANIKRKRNKIKTIWNEINWLLKKKEGKSLKRKNEKNTIDFSIYFYF